MESSVLAWSHSRLKMFLECPKQLWHTAVLKKFAPEYVGYQQTAAKDAGIAIDDALTERIGPARKPLPPQFAHWEGLADACARAPGAVFTQLDLALDQTFAPCGSKEWDKVWVRSKLDYANIRGSWALAADWKNGSIWVDKAQLRLYAVSLFHTYPELQQVDTLYGWLKHGKTSEETYRRRELGDLWQTFLPDLERYQLAYQTSHYPAEPKRGKSSCEWCPVNAAGKCPVALAPPKKQA